MVPFFYADSFSNPCATRHARIPEFWKGNSLQALYTLRVAQPFFQTSPGAGRIIALGPSVRLPNADKEDSVQAERNQMTHVVSGWKAEELMICFPFHRGYLYILIGTLTFLMITVYLL